MCVRLRILRIGGLEKARDVISRSCQIPDFLIDTVNLALKAVEQLATKRANVSMLRNAIEQEPDLSRLKSAADQESNQVSARDVRLCIHAVTTAASFRVQQALVLVVPE